MQGLDIKELMNIEPVARGGGGVDDHRPPSKLDLSDSSEHDRDHDGDEDEISDTREYTDDDLDDDIGEFNEDSGGGGHGHHKHDMYDDIDDDDDGIYHQHQPQKQSSSSYSPPRPSATMMPSSQRNKFSHMSRDELAVLKRKELAKIDRLGMRGYDSIRRFTMSDDINEIIAERERIEDMYNLQSSIETYRDLLIGFITICEYVNENYNDWFDLQLNGWTQSVYINISSYDAVFEELYYKYGGTISLPPEIRLVMMIGGSAAMFHFSKSSWNRDEEAIPEFSAVLENNPELKQAYQKAAAQQMMGRGGGGGVGRGGGGSGGSGAPGANGALLANLLGRLGQQSQPRAPGRGVPMMQQGFQSSPPNVSNPQMMQQMYQNQQYQNQMRHNQAPPTPRAQELQQSTPIDIEAPRNVDDILADITRNSGNPGSGSIHSERRLTDDSSLSLASGVKRTVKDNGKRKLNLKNSDI